MINTRKRNLSGICERGDPSGSLFFFAKFTADIMKRYKKNYERSGTMFEILGVAMVIAFFLFVGLTGRVEYKD